ncbi:MAG: DUF1131 family protein [Thiothrix sp.]|nr:DUF1131 family protein [Thiothrix sp.]HPQ96987.1 DUF1131 family protein [Thiolinea sp.]
MGMRPVFVLAMSAGLGCGLAGCNEGSGVDLGIEAASRPLMMLSVDGVGPLNATTPFNLVRIGQAFQDFNVTEETRFTEDEKYPVITVKQEVEPLLSINPDAREQNIFSIIVHDNKVGNGLGHRIGTRFADIYSYDHTERCVPGMEEWRGKVMCYAPHAHNILYLFEKPPGVDEAAASTDGVAPAPEKMADWMLGAIVWKSPRNRTQTASN